MLSLRCLLRIQEELSVKKNMPGQNWGLVLYIGERVLWTKDLEMLGEA